MKLFPELAPCADMLAASRRGLLFPLETAGRVGSMLAELVAAKGVRRIELFISILGGLAAAPARP